MPTNSPKPDRAEESNARNRRAIPPPEEYSNPPGIGAEVCDTDDEAQQAEPCDSTSAEDQVLEESKPGYGIFGYEGEEVGGG
ncbi:MAG: hypothetical protein Q7W51_02060 [Coriobacteriia bacterium]|nr:hypothetical protein [Coriobacteriia bacterium]